MFNKFGFLLVSVFVLLSNAIYANGDFDNAPLGLHNDSDKLLCLAAVKEAGAQYDVDFDLLQTISAVESGRWDNLHNRYIAWPWTVNINGKGFYFESREQALSEVKKAMAEGITNIDVGCMQINLKYHGEAFSSVEDAIDPVKNVQYSAKFLRNLYDNFGNNWEVAAKRYHSADPDKGSAYTQRLETRFNKFKIAGFSVNSTLFRK